MIQQVLPGNPFAIQHIRKRLAECDGRPLLARVTYGETAIERALVGRIGEIVRCNPTTGDIVLLFRRGPVDRAIIGGVNYQLVD